MDYDMTPEQASQGQLVSDRELIMLGAHWLAAGYESAALLQLASLAPAELSTARSLFEQALTELGHARDTTSQHDAWSGHWGFIDWVRSQVDRTHSPYAAAQRVLEVVGDEAQLWKPGHGPELVSLVNEWDANPADREALDDKIRTLLRALKADDGPRC